MIELLKVTDPELQGIFDPQTYRLGRSDSRAGAVGDLRVDGERVRGSVQGPRPRPYELWVRREGPQIVSQCNCTEWAGARRHCRHVAALLYSLVSEPGADTESPEVPKTKIYPPFSVWLPPEAAARAPLRLVYFVSFDGEGLTVRRLRADRGSEPEEIDLFRFPAEDQRIDEILRSLPHEARVGFRIERRRAGDLLAALRGRATFLDDRQQIPLVFSDETLGLRITGEPGKSPEESFRFRAALGLRGESRSFSLRTVLLFGGIERFAVVEDVAYPLDSRISLPLLERFQSNAQVSVRAEDLARTLLEWLPRLSESSGASVPRVEELIRMVEGKPSLQLKGEGDLARAEVWLQALYGMETEVIELGKDDETGPDIEIHFDANGKPYGLRRDRAAEAEALATLEGLGLHYREGAFRGEGLEALDFWTRGLPRLPSDWGRQFPPALTGVRLRSEPLQPQLSIHRGAQGWFAVDLRLLSEGIRADPEAVRAALEQGLPPFITLSDGTVARLETERLTPLFQAASDLDPELLTGTVLIPPWLAGPLQDLVTSVGPSAELDAATAELLQKLGGTLPEEALPSQLTAELRPYQKIGYGWFCALSDLGQGAMGALLADEMGLGKTLQTLTYLERQKERGVTAPALVVTPTSVLPNWLREASRFVPGLRAQGYSGSGRKLPETDQCDLIATSYALLRRDSALLRERRWSTVILDEAQNIKNPQSVTALSANELQADFRIALTGTPLENRPLDLWSIFRFLSPGLLDTQADFQRRYELPTGAAAETAHRRLAARLRPFLRRRLKRDVLAELPDKQESEMVSEMTNAQRELYLEVLGQVRSEIFAAIESRGVTRAQINILAGLLRLRQVACDPRLLKLPKAFGDEDSGKLLLWKELLDEALEGGHRVICFSQFVEMLKLMRSTLDEAGIAYEYLDGRSRDRQEIIDRFNQRDPAGANVFLISLRAGGSGLNLASADTVFIYDPWWNPAVEDQAVDRVHRIGQSKEVTVYRLLVRGTVEEKILELKQRKRSLSNRLVTGEGAPALTVGEIDELLRVG